jgi:ankyrin repeat protein
MLDVKPDQPDELHYNEWEVTFTPRYLQTSTPSVAGMRYIQKIVTDPVKVSEELSVESTKMESKFIKRVHHVTEYVGPIESCTNWFHYSRLPIFQAIGQGNLQWVRQLLRHTDVDPDCRNLQGWTTLQQACSIEPNYSERQKQIVQLLISNGADVNAPPGEGYGSTALQAACESGNEEIVDILLKQGADINAPAGPLAGMSALAATSYCGHFDLVKKLLNLGADINQSGSEKLGRNALSAAITSNHFEIFNYLVDKGFDLRGRGGLLALKTAIWKNNVEVVSRLLELGINVNDEIDGTAPVHAVQDLDMLKMLMTYGANLNAPCSQPQGLTALQSAACLGDCELLAELLRLGANVSYQGPTIRGRTALQSAAGSSFDTVSVMELLIEHGADVNEPRSAEEGYTSLEAACHGAVQCTGRPNIETIKFLLERGAKITTFTLHVAAAWNDEDLIKLLLQNGASTEDLREPSNTPIVRARYGDYRKFSSTVIKTAKINGYYKLGNRLENWPNPF